MKHDNYGTYFYHVNGDQLGSAPGLLSIPLYKGMQITVHSHTAIFSVVEWRFHLGHEDESAGLTIIVQ